MLPEASVSTLGNNSNFLCVPLTLKLFRRSTDQLFQEFYICEI